MVSWTNTDHGCEWVCSQRWETFQREDN